MKTTQCTEEMKSMMEASVNKLRSAYPESSVWKIMGLFFGARDQTGTIDPLNPNRLRRAGFGAARNVQLIDNASGAYVPLKLPTQDSMIGAEYSPLAYDGKWLSNELLEERIRARDYPLKAIPEITTLLPSASGTVGIMAFSGCSLFDRGLQCEFCTVGPAKGKTPVKLDTIIYELGLLEEAGYKPNNLSLNTGQLPESGRDLVVIGELVSGLKARYPSYNIAAEVGPFSFLGRRDLEGYLNKTGLDGVDTFMLNVELATDSARKQLCPAKPSLERYLSVMSELSRLGYQISSVLQLNFYPKLEKLEEVASYLQKIWEIGKGNIIPEFLISRAVKGNRLNDPYWIAIGQSKSQETVRELMMERFNGFVDRLEYISSTPSFRSLADCRNARAGCLKCGMCNINRGMENQEMGQTKII